MSIYDFRLPNVNKTRDNLMEKLTIQCTQQCPNTPLYFSDCCFHPSQEPSERLRMSPTKIAFVYDRHDEYYKMKASNVPLYLHFTRGGQDTRWKWLLDTIFCPF